MISLMMFGTAFHNPHRINLLLTMVPRIASCGVALALAQSVLLAQEASKPSTNAVATQAVKAQTKPQTVFDWLNANGLRFQRAFDGQPNAADPATVSFLSDLGKKSTVYDANFALIYQPDFLATTLGDNAYLSGLASIEGALTSDNSTAADDAWRFRLGLDSDFLKHAGDKHMVTVYTTLNAMYEADQAFRTRKITAELITTPSWLVDKQANPIGLGWDLDVGVGKFQWRPYFGVDVGDTLQHGPSAETEDTVLRLIGRVTARLSFPGAAKVLGVHDLYLSADDKVYGLPLETKETVHNYFVGGLRVEVSKAISLGVTYTVGADAPDFNYTRTVGAEFGVKF